MKESRSLSQVPKSVVYCHVAVYLHPGRGTDSECVYSLCACMLVTLCHRMEELWNAMQMEKCRFLFCFVVGVLKLFQVTHLICHQLNCSFVIPPLRLNSPFSNAQVLLECLYQSAISLLPKSSISVVKEHLRVSWSVWYWDIRSFGPVGCKFPTRI